MTRAARTRLGLVLAVATCAAPAAANRRLIGLVTDEEGTPLAGVTVALFNIGGEGPKYERDRSAVNSEGAGADAFRSHNNQDWSERAGDPAASAEALVELATDDSGHFTFATLEFVGAIAVRLEKEGFAVEVARFAFPLGTTKQTFILGEPQAARDRRAQERFDAGVALMQAKEWEQGRDAFLEVVAVRPDLEHAWLNLAIACFQLGDYQHALTAAKRLEKLKPGHPVAKMMIRDAEKLLKETDDG